MPAPVECRVDFKIQKFEGTYEQPKPTTILTIDCNSCPLLDSVDFKADTRYFDNPVGIVVRNAGEFLARNCGLKRAREAVILPRGL